MTAIRIEFVVAAIQRADALINSNINNDLVKQYEFIKQTILNDESLTFDEKQVAIKLLTQDYDHFKVLYNLGTQRQCENCALECLATLYCECSEIYSAIWIDGPYFEWNLKEQQLKRAGAFKVILKKLKDVVSAKRNWFEEAKPHLILSNRYNNITKCYGLTQDPTNEDYMLVMQLMDTDLRNYLRHQHSWKEN
ncbi:kinase-like domain-containing protein [Rhizophagus clarus]|uniref:Kinase-like domain-containing protein n=1 Tax=Rhizophagus clarus TaxID=94130 RepID=A0A8H3KS12_9GLOM|nr:kinase-like domain-containing protein [Rhizophagus clarus]